MSQGHLRFDLKVDHVLREAEMIRPPGMSADAVRTLLANGAPTLATLDWADVTVPKVARLIDPAAKESGPHGPASLARWTATSGRARERYPSEGSSLLLGGMEREQCFGYVHLTLIVRREPGLVCFCARVHRVSIHGPERATAHTMDLALAAGVLAADVLVALYSSVPHATTISIDIVSDSDLEPGALVASQVQSSLARRVGHLNLQRRRSSVAVAMPTLRASFPKSRIEGLPAY